jgi:transcriptional regulator with XRE-family HTH domain
MESDIFKKQLREALKIRNLTQAELAERTGLLPSAVSHFISGTRNPSFETLRKISKALDVSTDFLLGRSDSPDAPSTSNDELNRHASQIQDAKSKEQLIEFAKFLLKKEEE